MPKLYFKNQVFHLKLKKFFWTSPWRLKGEGGFTLLEIILVMGILVILLSIGLPISLNFYRSYQFDSEATLLISLLEDARTLAMVNFNEFSHGLYLDTNNFTVFQGSSYASRVTSQDKNFLRNTTITIVGPSEIVFAQLSGQTASSTFNVSNSQRNTNVNVNAEGTILY